jgi:hypothetical protein
MTDAHPDGNGHGAPSHGPPRAPAVGTLCLLALAWLLLMVSSARFTIGDSPAPTPLALTRAALEFPQVVSAAVVAGVAVGLVATGLPGRLARSVMTRPPGRYAVSTAAAGVLGAGLATATVVGYGALPGIGMIAGTVAAAAAIGGLVAGVRQRAVVAAAVAGTLAMFAVRFVSGLFDVELRALFGGGDTAQEVLASNTWLVLAGAAVAGAVAGALSYAYLRRSAPAGTTWPGYLLAGALPGLLSLLAELVTQVGGARLFALVGDASAPDRAVIAFLATARINQALVVLFVGALVALILLGRTLPPARADPPGGPGHPGN